MTSQYIEIVPGLYLTEEEFESYIDGKFRVSHMRDAKLGENIQKYITIGDFLAQNIGKGRYRDYVSRHEKQLLGGKNQNKNLKRALGIKEEEDQRPPRRH